MVSVEFILIQKYKENHLQSTAMQNNYIFFLHIVFCLLNMVSSNLWAKGSIYIGLLMFYYNKIIQPK